MQQQSARIIAMKRSMVRIAFMGSLLASAVASAPALAMGGMAPPVPYPGTVGACSNLDLTPNALSCEGFYQGNLNNGSPEDTASQIAALGDLGFVWDGSTIVEKLEGSSIFAGDMIDFTPTLYGISFLSIHWGAGEGPVKLPGGTTAFYKIDAGDAGIDKFLSSFGSISNAVLYKTGTKPDDGGGGTGSTVPEPAIWAQFLLGFGIAGVIARRRRPQTVSA